VTASISFAVRPYPDGHGTIEVVPVVGGTELTDRVHEFEREAGMETRATSYGGLIPSSFRFGPALAHYCRAGGDPWNEASAKIPVLGCQCGEWGCWPLVTRILMGESTVTWTEFEQPHRKGRDYSGFGPFVFDRRAYEDAVRTLAEVWDAEDAR
jgi:hypothetical protein